MKHYECPIIADLLPSYAEGLTSQKTNILVSEHLISCESCRNLLNDYTAEIPAPFVPHPKDKKQVSRLRLQLLWYMFWPLLYGLMYQLGHPGTLVFFSEMLFTFGFVLILSHNMEFNFAVDKEKRDFYQRENQQIDFGHGTFLTRGLILLLPILLPTLFMLIPALVRFILKEN